MLSSIAWQGRFQDKTNLFLKPLGESFLFNIYFYCRGCIKIVLISSVSAILSYPNSANGHLRGIIGLSIGSEMTT